MAFGFPFYLRFICMEETSFWEVCDVIILISVGSVFTLSTRYFCNLVHTLTEMVHFVVACCSLSSCLTNDAGYFSLHRVESYSCKMAGNDKRLYKIMNSGSGTSPNDLQALSPPQGIPFHSTSPHRSYR